MLTYHSSTLLPGATSYATNAAERGAFLAALEGYLAFFMGECGGTGKRVSEVAAESVGRSDE
jgi:hypothetical protein